MSELNDPLSPLLAMYVSRSSSAAQAGIDFGDFPTVAGIASDFHAIPQRFRLSPRSRDLHQVGLSNCAAARQLPGIVYVVRDARQNAGRCPLSRQPLQSPVAGMAPLA